jgi:hypothetical protein
MDSVSLVLLAAAVATLSAAISVGLRPVGGSIPEHLLNRVRGANNGQALATVGSCSAINAVPPAVAYNACAAAGTTCIACAVLVQSYQANGNPGQFDPNNFWFQSCVPPGGSGTTGTCTLNARGLLLCANPSPFACLATAQQYATQP